MTKLLPLLFVSFALTSTAIGQTPKTGEPSPVGFISNLVQSSVDEQKLPLSELNGRVVVIEFWATWCGPCIPALQHLQEVASGVDEEQAVVVAIAIEEESRLLKFLKRNEYPDLWFASDPQREVFQKFGLVGIPNTVILDPQGRIAAMTTPDEVTAEVLSRVAAGKPAGVREKVQRGVNVEWSPSLDEDGGEVFARLVIAEADPEAHGGGSKFAPGSGRISGDGLALGNLLQIAFDIRRTRMTSGFPPHRQGDPTYRVSVLAPGGNDQLARDMLAEALKVKFGFEARRETRTVDAFFLRRVEGGPAWEKSAVEPGEGTFRASGGGLELVGKPIGPAAQWLENLVGKPVVDETGLTDRYDLKMEWVDGPSLKAELRRVGLQLEKGQAPVEFLVIEPY